MKLLNCEKMRMVLVGVVAAMVVSSGSVKADFTWARKTDMPTTAFLPSASVVGGKIYVIGGWHSIGEWNPQWEALTRVDEYDPTTDTWTRKADMPTGRGHTNACVVDDKIYVIGGEPDVGVGQFAVEVYDPATDTWTRKADMPSRRRWFSACEDDGIIYVIGGVYDNAHSRIVEAYNPSTDTWTRKADMFSGRSFLATCVMDGLIYAIGGGAPGRKDVEVYDPATNTWMYKASMPTGRYELDAVVVDGKIYAIGGWSYSTTGHIYSTVEVYDPVTNTWTRGVDIPVTTAGLSASAVDGIIYVMGGATATHLNEHWILTSAVYTTNPIVDFNGDRTVDVKDVIIMTEHWGENFSLCDIGPSPLGDGIVDVLDLVVLTEYIEPIDRTLIAHWELDETEGMYAADSVGGHDGILYGEPIWQPTGGQVCGALELDGIDDYVETDFVLDPADGAFSVFAWIQGGAPGQLIISQTDGNGAGETWLGTDTVGGNLMTGLVPQKIGWVNPRPLVSEFIVSDGQWSHIGLVWDGSYRALYIDGVEVAKDKAAQNPLKSADGGLYIGASKDLDAGTFFSGMIDDIRIYNQALTAEEIAALAH